MSHVAEQNDMWNIIAILKQDPKFQQAIPSDSGLPLFRCSVRHFLNLNALIDDSSAVLLQLGWVSLARCCVSACCVSNSR